MEIVDSQIVGALIGLGLVAKGIAEVVVRRKSKGDIPPLLCQKCNVPENFDRDYTAHKQRVMLALTEILAILHERK